MSFNYLEFEKEIEQHLKKLDRLCRSWSRMWFANPDLCLYFRNLPRFDYRYMRKIGAKRGIFIIAFGWLEASIRW